MLSLMQSKNEDKPNEKRIGNLFTTCYSKGVSYLNLNFGKNSKASKGVGRLSSGTRGRLLVCPDWRLLAWGSWWQAD